MPVKGICLVFQAYQAQRLNRFRFFDIGGGQKVRDEKRTAQFHFYLAEKCYLPVINILKESSPDFKLSLSIPSAYLERLLHYTPEVVEGLKLAKKSIPIDFLASPSHYGLDTFWDPEALRKSVKEHQAMMFRHFRQKSRVFFAPELLYKDFFPQELLKLGVEAAIQQAAPGHGPKEGEQHLYYHPKEQKFRFLLRNAHLSDTVWKRFGDKQWEQWPFNPLKWLKSIEKLDGKDEVLTLVMPLEVFGGIHKGDTGILAFLKSLESIVKENSELRFFTATEVLDHFQPEAKWSPQEDWGWEGKMGEKDLEAELIQQLQKKWKALKNNDKVNAEDLNCLNDWRLIKELSWLDQIQKEGAAAYTTGSHDLWKSMPKIQNSYDAFIHYMNILSHLESK